MSEEPAAEPRRVFGLATASFVVIASMIGTGVLTTSGYTVRACGSNQWMLLLWIIGGLVAICGALSVAELSTAMPRTGGDYVFLLEAYGPLPAFLSGWVSFLIGFGGPIALSASASARYLLDPWPIAPEVLPIAQRGLATCEILLLAVVHCLGQHSSRRAQAGTTLTKLAVLITLACFGLAAGFGRWRNLFDAPTVTPEIVGGSLFSLVYIAYAYTGWNGAGYIAGEVERPRILVPRAILIGTCGVMALYLALNTFYALALTPTEIESHVIKEPGKPDDTSGIVQIASLAARQLFGGRVSTVVSFALGLTLVASVSAYVLTGPRVALAMAQAGQFPAFAGRTSPKGAPVAATILQVGWAVVLLWCGPFQSVLEYASVGLAMISLLTIGALFVLRRTRPNLERPFRVPFYPVIPGLYMAATALLCGAAMWQKPLEAGMALATIAVGVPAFWIWQTLKRRASA
jgi:APA family basic amino acid/polyamine antiporter